MGVEGLATLHPETEHSRAARRTPVLPLVFVLVGQLASYLPQLSDTYQYNQFNRDDAEMLATLAQSLAHGRGYTLSVDPASYRGHTHYPPGHPLPLAACFLVSDSFLLPQLVMVLYALGSSVLFWFWAHRYLPTPLVFLALLLMVCSPIYDQLATVLMSEHATLFFVLLTAWSFTCWSEDGYRFRGWAWLTAAALGYGLLVRGLVLPLLPALWVYAWLDAHSGVAIRARVLRVTAILGLAILPLTAWEVRNLSVNAPPGIDGLRHTEEILRQGDPSGPILRPDQFLALVYRNLKWAGPARAADSFAGVGWLLESSPAVSLPSWVAAVILLLFGLCLLRALLDARRSGLPLLFFLFSAVLLLIWHAGGAPRYWMQLTPVMLLLIFQGLISLGSKCLPAGTKSRLALKVAVGVACLFPVAVLAADHQRREPQCGAAWQAYVDACKHARTALPPNAVLVGHNPFAAQLISGRHGELTDADKQALQGLGGPAPREVYVLVPGPRAVAEHGRRCPPLAHGNASPPPGAVPGRPDEVWRNEYHVLYRLVRLPGSQNHDRAGAPLGLNQE